MDRMVALLLVLSSIDGSTVVGQLQQSVLKISGVASSCQKALEGSGFVVAPELVMTNAHVVAGTDGVTVDSVGSVFDAEASARSGIPPTKTGWMITTLRHALSTMVQSWPETSWSSGSPPALPLQ